MDPQVAPAYASAVCGALLRGAPGSRLLMEPRVRGWFGRQRFRVQILMFMFAIVFVSLGVSALIAFPTMRRAQYEIRLDRLLSTGQLRQTWVERHFHVAHDRVRIAGRTELTVAALAQFSAAVRSAAAQGGASALDDLRRRYVGSAASTTSTSAPTSVAAEPIVGGLTVATAAYEARAEIFDPSMRELTAALELDDLLLVTAAERLVAYSVRKGPEFLRLITDPGVAAHVQRCAARVFEAPGSPDSPALIFEDFAERPWLPGESVACIGAPVFAGGSLIGVVLALAPITPLDGIVLEQGEWAHGGIATYLVGPDHRIRSGSRIARRPSASEALDHEGVRAALGGTAGSGVVPGGAGAPCLAVWFPVRIDEHGRRWALVAEMNEADVYAVVNRNTALMVGWWSGMLVLLLAMAFIFSRRVDRAVRALVRRTQALAAGEAPTALARAESSREFSELVHSFDDMTKRIQARAVAAERAQQAELQEREERLRAIFEAAVEAIIVIDGNGQIEAFNPAAERMFGHSAAEIIHREFGELLPQPHRDDYESHMCGRSMGRARPIAAVPREITALRKDGTTFAAEMALSEMTLRGARMFAASLRDITDRKAAEESVRASGQRLRRQNEALVALAKVEPQHGPQEGACVREVTETAARTIDAARCSVWFFDESGANLRCMQLYDGAAGCFECGMELSTADFPAYFAALGRERIVAADDALNDPRTRELADGYLRRKGITSLLDAAIHAGGRTVGVICFEHIGEPRTWQIDEQTFASAVADLVALLKESMERDKAEAALAESQERLALTFAATNDAIFDIDLMTDKLVVNPRFYALCDVPPGELDRAAWRERIHGEDRDRVERVIQRHLTDVSAPLEVEYRQRAQAGAYIWIQMRASVVGRDASGRPTRIVGTQRDVTDRRRAQEAEAERAAADEANKAKSQFLANMSHELRTPLNGVLGYAQILQRDPIMGPQQRECLEAIESCGQHLLTLINDVLDLSKIEAGRMEVRHEPCDLPQLLTDVGHVVRQRAEAKGLRFDLEMSPEVPRGVLTDATKLRQVLVNLLGNAVKFTAVGNVSLSVAPGSDGRLRFAVRDSGVGIPSDKLGEIFDAFKQTAAGVAAGGTGLGLAISRKLVEALDGKLEVQSELGQGSCFYFSLPIVAAEAGQLGEMDSPAERRAWRLAPGQRVRVLIADDRSANRDILVRLLGAAGIETMQCENGQQALELTRRERPDVVLMDVRMPIMDGLTATRAIRAEPDMRSTVVIAVTASVFPDAQRQALDAGCDDIIGKPFRAGEVFSKIERHLKVAFEEPGVTGGAPLAAAGVEAGVAPAALAPAEARVIAGRLRAAADVGSITELTSLATSLTERGGAAAVYAAEIARHANAFDFEALQRMAAAMEQAAIVTAEVSDAR